MNAHERTDRPCPLCGGALVEGPATIPFMLGRHVVVIKDAPAEICEACGEPFLHRGATDVVLELLAQARAMAAEVTVLTYSASTHAAA